MKKKIVGLAVVVALVLATMFLIGCGDDTTATTGASEISTTTQAPTTTTQAPPASTEAPTTTTPASEITFKYAHSFSIENLEDGCKTVTDYAGVEFLLVPKGQQPPAGYEDLPTISIPIERAVFMSTTQVCCLRPLGALDVVVGVASDRDSWYVDGIKEGIDAGTIQVIATGMGEPDYEKVVALSRRWCSPTPNRGLIPRRCTLSSRSWVLRRL